MQVQSNIKPGIMSLFFILAGLVCCLCSNMEQISYEGMITATFIEPMRTFNDSSAPVIIRTYGYETRTLTFTEYPYRDFGAILVFVGFLAEIGICLRSRRKEKETEIGIY